MLPKKSPRALVWTILGAILLVLAGMGIWAATPHAWANNLKSADGVVSADVTYRPGLFFLGGDLSGEIIVSPDLTQQQVREIVERSCKYRVFGITEVGVHNYADYSASGKVSDFEVSRGACIDEDVLALFARANAAMSELLPNYEGEFLIHGIRESNKYDSTKVEGSYRVQAYASDESMLLDALGKLHTKIDDRPLEFYGGVSEGGDSLLLETQTIEAQLSVEADFDRLQPVITQAFTLDQSLITVGDNTVTVEIVSSDALATDAVSEFHRLGEEMGIETRAALAPWPTERSELSADEKALNQAKLVDALTAVPGGATVVVTEDTSHNILIVANEIEGIVAAAGILEATTEPAARFTIQAAPLEGFELHMETGVIGGQPTTSAAERLITLRQELSGVESVKVTMYDIRVALDVRLADSSTAEDEAAAREILTELRRTQLYGEVSLYGANIDFGDNSIE